MKQISVDQYADQDHSDILPNRISTEAQADAYLERYPHMLGSIPREFMTEERLLRILEEDPWGFPNIPLELVTKEMVEVVALLFSDHVLEEIYHPLYTDRTWRHITIQIPELYEKMPEDIKTYEHLQELIKLNGCGSHLNFAKTDQLTKPDVLNFFRKVKNFHRMNFSVCLDIGIALNKNEPCIGVGDTGLELRLAEEESNKDAVRHYRRLAYLKQVGPKLLAKHVANANQAEIFKQLFGPEQAIIHLRSLKLSRKWMSEDIGL